MLFISFPCLFMFLSQVYQILEGIEYHQESLQAKRPRNGKYGWSCICCYSKRICFWSKMTQVRLLSYVLLVMLGLKGPYAI